MYKAYKMLLIFFLRFSEKMCTQLSLRDWYNVMLYVISIFGKMSGEMIRSVGFVVSSSSSSNFSTLAKDSNEMGIRRSGEATTLVASDILVTFHLLRLS